MGSNSEETIKIYRLTTNNRNQDLEASAGSGHWVSSQNLAKGRAAARQFTDVFCTHNIKIIKIAHPLTGADTFQLIWK